MNKNQFLQSKQAGFIISGAWWNIIRTVIALIILGVVVRIAIVRDNQWSAMKEQMGVGNLIFITIFISIYFAIILASNIISIIQPTFLQRKWLQIFLTFSLPILILMTVPMAALNHSKNWPSFLFISIILLLLAVIEYLRWLKRQKE